MVSLDSVLGLLLIIVLIIFFIFFRKKLIALVLDIAIGTVVYLAAVFMIVWVGFSPPLVWTEDLYPIMVFIFILYHFFMNYNMPQRSKPLGAL